MIIPQHTMQEIDPLTLDVVDVPPTNAKPKLYKKGHTLQEDSLILCKTETTDTEWFLAEASRVYPDEIVVFLCHCDCLWASSARRSASLHTLWNIVDSHFSSGSCKPVPLSGVICCLGEALASVIVRVLNPWPASNGLQLITELKAVLWANAIAGR
jgi:hypothetical protein